MISNISSISAQTPLAQLLATMLPENAQPNNTEQPVVGVGARDTVQISEQARALLAQDLAGGAKPST